MVSDLTNKRGCKWAANMMCILVIYAVKRRNREQLHASYSPVHQQCTITKKETDIP